MNTTSSKPIKKMVLWTRVNNSKSTSPHIKEKTNGQKKKLQPNLNFKSGKKEKEHINMCQNEKKVLSPFLKSKGISNFNNNRNYTRVNANNILNSQGGSFQSNSNEEDKNNSKFNDSCNKKIDKDSVLINNVKYKKNINISYSPNSNTNNINSSEFHANNTYKYFQTTNETKLKKKESNKNNCITDNNILGNISEKSASKSKNSIDKNKKKLNNLNNTIKNKKHSPNNMHKIAQTDNKLNNYLNINNNSNINSLNNNNRNTNYANSYQSKRNVNSITSTQKLCKNISNDILDDSNSSRNKKNESNNSNNKKNNNLDIIKNLELENKKLKQENLNLSQKNKELTIYINKLENEVLEIKSVIKENLNQFIQPQNDLVHKTYNQFMEQIDKQKLNLTKILNYKKSNITKEEEEKTKDETINNQKSILNDERKNYKLFKKNFFEFFNHVNISNTNINGYPSGEDPLKSTLNSFCCLMDNIINKLEDIFINIDKKENKNKDNIYNNNYINNFAEICLINLYYEYVIMQLFIVSFFERQHCYYCYSIIDYILISPFIIIKNNNYIKDYSKKINNVIEAYKKINEEYINKYTEQNIFYLDNYIKLFNIIINNKLNIINNIKIDTDVFTKNTNILFNKDNEKQNVYLDMINSLLEKIKNNNDLNTERLFDKKLKTKNKINLIKLSGDNYDMISNLSNASSKIIDNYSEKPSFYGYLKSEDCPPDMSFEDEEM